MYTYVNNFYKKLILFKTKDTRILLFQVECYTKNINIINYCSITYQYVYL